MAPSFVACSTPIWEDGRFTTCIQQKYIANFLPIASVCISVAFILVPYLHHRRRKLQLDGFQPLPNAHSDHLLDNPPNRPLPVTHGPWLIRAEGCVLATNIASLIPFIVNVESSLQWIPLGLLLSDIYVLLLWVGRHWGFSGQSTISMSMRFHSGLLYTLYWVFMINILLSALAEPVDGFWFFASLLRVSLFTILLLIHISAPVTSDDSNNHEKSGLYHPAKEASASVLSRWSFSWASGVIWKAFSNPLKTTDLYALNREDRAAITAEIFHRAIPVTLKLLWRLFHFVKSDLIYQGAWAVVFSVASFCPAILLRAILGYLESPETMSRNNAWLCVGGLLVVGIITGISDCQCEWAGRKVSVRMRAILINEVFMKVLRRRGIRSSATTKEGEEEPTENQASDGNVLNLMAVDTASISEVSAHMHLVCINFPLQLTIASFVLYANLGISGILGVVFMIALLPFNVLVSKRQVAAQMKVLSAGDARVQASTELISNIRVIKLCTWEAEFQKRVRSLRKTELSELRGRFFWWSISMTVFYSLPFITTIMTLFLYTIVEKKKLETKSAFPALAAFAVLRIPLDRMSAMISFMLQAHVSVGRIEAFLNEKEVTTYNQSTEVEYHDGDDSPIGFDDATLEWPGTRERATEATEDIQWDALDSGGSFRLSNLQIHFRKNGLNAIFGPSGSGKSSLLLALLGEMDLLRGRVNLTGSGQTNETWFSSEADEYIDSKVAYCSQEPWIINQSIRANILFGLPFRGERYRSVLDAVSLVRDLAEFENGDLVIAGERGNRLSGGQKQRVALARAIYSNAQFVILDDCLSALDPRTGKNIFFHAIKGPLMQGRTCVLATHHSQLVLPQCDYAVVLENGCVKRQGSASDILGSGLVATDLRGIQKQDLVQSSDPLYQSQSATKPKGGSKDPIDTSSDIETEDEDETWNLGVEPVYQEDKSTGAVPFSVIKRYLNSMGSFWFWISVLFAFILQQLTSLSTNLWIKRWALEFDKLNKLPQSEQSADAVNSKYYLIVYGLICLSYVLVSFARDLSTFAGALKASSRIFDNLLDSVLHASLTFFDKVPFGQITNRFSRDVSAIDQEVTVHSMSTLYTFCSLATILILISAMIPVFLPVAAIICGAYYIITKVYINSARDLKRMESVQQSPLYQHFGEALSGCISIRAYGHVRRFTEENYHLIDGFNQPYVLLWAAKEWLTVRVACLSAFISWLAGTFLLWRLDKGDVDPGTAGLVLTYAATFTENVLWLVQLYAIVQQSFNSVDRVFDYTAIPSEPSEPIEPTPYDLSPEWPSQGSVSFEQYTTRYAAELDPVLTDITFNIPAGKRVAVVGRTGAGKSTLALALIRALEADSGHIAIDGTSIASISLSKLRNAVTVVPQDPTLFHGTVRDNLDPLHQHSDIDLRTLLQELEFFRSLTPETLDNEAIALSLGQRQLVCLARALLRRPRVLILDEATASIDHETDTLIQRALRSSVARGTTILTIAHRLISVADYDWLVVMDAGKIAEQGSVAELLHRRDKSALFRQMCEQSGDLAHIEQAAGVETLR